MYTFGVFLVPVTTELNWERGAISGAYSMYMLISGPLAILSGRLSDKYKHGARILVTFSGLLTGIGFLLMSQIKSLWQAYLILGFFMGIGSSCGSIPLNATIPRWFAKRRGIAVGIAIAGIGLGATIAPSLAQWLISAYGWRQAFLILGLITLIIVVPLAQFIKHSPQQIGLKPYGENGIIEDKQSLVTEMGSFKQAIKTSHFWLLGLIRFCFVLYMQAVIIHLVPYAVDIGIPAIIAAGIMSIHAGVSVIGRLSMGFISDRIGGRLALSVSLITLTLALIWLPLAKEIWVFYIFAVVFGLAYGGVVPPLLTLLPAEFFGLKSLGIILGALNIFLTVGGSFGPPLAGSIFDVTGSYSLAFLIYIILSTLAFMLSLILLRSKGKGGILGKG